MGLETASFISELNVANPVGGVDSYSSADDHLRLIKTVLKTQFPNLGAAAVNPTVTELNHLVGVTSGLQAQLNGKVSPDLLKYCAGLAVAKSVTNDTWTDIQCDSADILDVGSWHNPASNPQNFVVPAGVVAVEFECTAELFSADGTQTWWALGIRIQQNGATKRSTVQTTNAMINNWIYTVSTRGMIPVAAGDVLKMQAWVDSSGNQGASISSAYMNLKAIA